MLAQALRSVFALSRNGNLLTNEGLSIVTPLARLVKNSSNTTYSAPSAASAAAWLLLAAHDNANLSGERSTLPESIPLSSSLCFRGQPSKFELLTPSISRVESEHRTQNEMSKAWFQIGLQLWCDRRFRFTDHEDHWRQNHSYWMDRQMDVEPVAQHYGLGTNLMDWTWDPIVAISFASHRLDVYSSDAMEHQGCVCLRAIHPESAEQAMLPPSFATRIWRQRGLFQYQPDPIYREIVYRELGALGPLMAGRQRVTSYPNITFTCAPDEKAAAKEVIDGLLLEDDPVMEIVEWARDVSHVFPQLPSRSLTYLPNIDELKEQLPTKLFQAFVHILASTPDVREDVPLMIDYVNSVAIRSTANGCAYDAWALYLLANAMTDRHYLCRTPLPNSEALVNTLQGFMSRTKFFLGPLHDGCFGRPPMLPLTGNDAEQ